MNVKRIKRIVIVFFVVGLTGLTSLIYLEKEVERVTSKKVDDFENFSIRRSNEMKNNLQVKKNALEYLVAFFNSSNNVSIEEFKLFTSSMVKSSNLTQVCWQNTTTSGTYFTLNEHKDLCEKVNFIESSNIYKKKNKQIISLSEFTISFSKEQRGVLTVFFDLSEIDILGSRNIGNYSETIFVNDRSRKELGSFKTNNIQKTENEVIKSKIYILEEIGQLKFVYFSKLYNSSMNSIEFLNILLVCLLLPIIGIFISFYYWSQENKREEISNEVDARTEELFEVSKENEQLNMRFSLALTASGIGVWDWSFDDNKLVCDPNIYKHYGTSIEDELSSQEIWLKSIHKDDSARVYNEFIASLKTDKKFDTEYRVVWPNNQVRYLRSMADTFKDTSGKTKRMVGVNWDITESKKLENELIRSNRDLDQFAYIASHDLREPLRGMRNFAQFLIDDYSDKLDKEGKEYLGVIKKLGGRLESYLDSLLFYSRFGREKITYKETDLNELISQIKQTYIDLSIKGVSIITQEDLPTITCDPLKLTKVIGNLLQNAIRYNDKNEKVITIKYRNMGESRHQFWVTDNGIGMKKNHWDRIFTIFKRLHPKDEYEQGSGLGLTLAHKAVQQHGGEIRVESSEVGVGTTFTFTIHERPE